MKITQNIFDKNLKQNYLFEKSPTIAVAVSGGPDSMCLTFLLSKWINKKKGNLIVLIIDHLIRSDSATESKYIKKYLLNQKIESEIIKIKKNKVIKKNMNEARNNRFEELFKYCKKKKILHLFIGHHSDDNLETFLLRSLAGSNLEGLRSMQNKTDNDSLQIIRPLLKFSKKEIINYNQYNKIDFISDPSNLDMKYSRVVVRNFLSNDSEEKKQLIKDFENIKKIYPYYKQMIFQKFNKLCLNISDNKILLDKSIFFKQDLEIQTKIIAIIYRYLKPKRISIRYKKVLLSIYELKQRETSQSNIGGMNIKKEGFYINFSH